MPARLVRRDVPPPRADHVLDREARARRRHLHHGPVAGTGHHLHALHDVDLRAPVRPTHRRHRLGLVLDRPGRVPRRLPLGRDGRPGPRRPGPRLTSPVPVGNPGAETIERSPADVLRFVVAAAGSLALVVVEWLFGDTLIAFGSDLLRGLDAVPQWIVDVVALGTRILAAVMLGGGLLWTVYRQRWRMLVTVGVAGLLAAGLFVLVDDLVRPDDGGDPVDVGVDAGPVAAEGFPTAPGIAVAAAVPPPPAPLLNRRWRRAGWVLLVGLLLTRFLATPLSFDSLEAALVGWLAGAGVLVALGAPSRRPTRDAVVAGLSAVDLAVRRLDPASVDARGSTPYFGVTSDRSQVFVKALGEDERSADVLFRLYRRLTPRDFGDERPSTTLRSPTACWRRAGNSWASSGATASPIGTSGWPTSSSTTTAGCGSSTSASVRWRPRICCSPTTS